MSLLEKIAQRVGTQINELDIDFSRFTLCGWLVSGLSLVTGGGVAYAAYQLVPDAGGMNQGPALVFGLTMIGVTVVVFLGSRSVAKRIGFDVVRSQHRFPASQEATIETLWSLSDRGVDLSVPHCFDFHYAFSDEKQATKMIEEAQSVGFEDIVTEPATRSFDLDICVRVELLPSVEMITATESQLNGLAHALGGRPEGWGLRTT